ncbi:MAG: BTAD domain-containing putative transcriptional regulator [Gammaproteobacteria bacterium]|nr:BTAD domain-containing putative transcriptional regulator [Gammaproteobacteria bacterium]
MTGRAGSASLAKTTRPSRAGVLARQRLFAILDGRGEGSVVWLWGPPGSGKTTLVASYLEQRDLDSRWYQLDRGDSDVATFFYYMTRGAGDAGLPLFTAEYHGGLAAFSRRYFERLYAGLARPFALVLDNYHELADQSAFHQVLMDAVAELPPEGCIVVMSRGEPPPAMARLRASRALELLGWERLRLTRAESDAMVALWGDPANEATLARLYETTEGWAAGLVLMLEHGRTSGSLEALPGPGAPQAIFDYLAGEIFAELDERAWALLLECAFLQEVTASMAERLTGDPEAPRILAELHRRHHFLSTKSGGAEPVYQFHPLLGAFLKARAAQRFSAEQCRAIRRASAALLEAVGQVDDAVALLREDLDFKALERLVLEHAPDMLSHGRAETLENWLQDLPEEVLEHDPWCQCWLAACRFMRAPRESRLLYERAYSIFARGSDEPGAGSIEGRATEARRGMLLACAGAMDAIVFELDDLTLLDGWIEQARRLLDDELTGAFPEQEARATVSLFIALVFRQPTAPDLKLWAERAFHGARSLSDINARMSGELMIAITLNYTGQFERARALMDEMRVICDSPDVTPLALTVLKDVESMYYMLTADHGQCLDAAHQGIAVCNSSGVHLWHYHLLSLGVAAALSAGDVEQAQTLLAQMHQQQAGARRLDLCGYHYYEAWLAMLRGELMDAHRAQRTALRLATETGCPFYEVLCRLALAQILEALGDRRRTLSNLRRVRDLARDIDNRLLEFMCLCTLAHVALRQGRERIGLDLLRRAFGVGRAHGFMHFPWWQPRVMGGLCARALEAGIEVEYTRKLIEARNLMPDPPPVEVTEWPWPMRIRAFGEFEVFAGEHEVFAKERQKPVELLKTLLAFGGEDVPETLLEEALWPRIDGDYAHRSFTTTLHRLRKHLPGDQCLVLKHGRLSLDPAFCWLDLRAFERVAARIERALETKRVAEQTVSALASKLLDLYRGPFMAGESSVPRYDSMRERLRSKFVRYLGMLARYFEDRGDWQRAAGLFERAVAADSMLEGCYRRLMLCYRALGRAAEAVDLYDSYRRLLQAENGQAPSPETTAIYLGIVEDLKRAMVGSRS